MAAFTPFSPLFQGLVEASYLPPPSLFPFPLLPFPLLLFLQALVDAAFLVSLFLGIDG